MSTCLLIFALLCHRGVRSVIIKHYFLASSTMASEFQLPPFSLTSLPTWQTLKLLFRALASSELSPLVCAIHTITIPFQGLLIIWNAIQLQESGAYGCPLNT